MTPGPIDLKIVADRLAIVASCLEALRRLPTASLDDFRADWRNAAAADSLLRRAIEALFDAARHILAKARASDSARSNTAKSPGSREKRVLSRMLCCNRGSCRSPASGTA